MQEGRNFPFGKNEFLLSIENTIKTHIKALPHVIDQNILKLMTEIRSKKQRKPKEM